MSSSKETKSGGSFTTLETQTQTQTQKFCFCAVLVACALLLPLFSLAFAQEVIPVIEPPVPASAPAPASAEVVEVPHHTGGLQMGIVATANVPMKEGEHVPGLQRLENPTGLQNHVTRYHTLDRSAHPYALFLAMNGGALCQRNGCPDALGITALLAPEEELRVHPRDNYYYVLLPKEESVVGVVPMTEEVRAASTQQAAGEIEMVVQNHPRLGPITVFRNRNSGKLADRNLVEVVRPLAGGKEILFIPAGMEGAHACYTK